MTMISWCARGQDMIDIATYQSATGGGTHFASLMLDGNIITTADFRQGQFLGLY